MKRFALLLCIALFTAPVAHAQPERTAVLVVELDASELERRMLRSRAEETPLADEERRTMVRKATARTIEILRRRLDPTGSASITFTQPEDGRITIRTPASDAARVRERVGSSRGAAFHLVAEPGTEGAINVQPHPFSDSGPELIVAEPSFTGANLVSANAVKDEITGMHIVTFRLDADGQRAFCRLTRDNVQSRFAMLINGKVLTAPTIVEPICGGSAHVTGSYSASEAEQIAQAMRDSALPAPLMIVSEYIE